MRLRLIPLELNTRSEEIYVLQRWSCFHWTHVRAGHKLELLELAKFLRKEPEEI